MQKTLGIMVSSDLYFDNIIKMCNAATGKDVEVFLFLTHKGLLLTKHPAFGELKQSAKIALCKEGLENHNIDQDSLDLEKDSFSTQAANAELIRSCDRYLVF
jgi:hypothetical protein